MNRFGVWLTRQREARGWTRTELATFVRSDKSQVTRWEAGEILPTLPRFGRLCRVLSVDANEVLRMLLRDDDAAAA